MRHVLVCDDEKDIVAALKIYLEAEGYHVLTAFNGREALEVFAREPVDLILLDIMMPGMDGITTMSRLREQSNVPVIFLTAKSEDTDKVLGLNVGADDYITKPFKLGVLFSRINALLRRAKAFDGSETELSSNGLQVRLELEPHQTENMVTVKVTALNSKGKELASRELDVRILNSQEDTQ